MLPLANTFQNLSRIGTRVRKKKCNNIGIPLNNNRTLLYFIDEQIVLGQDHEDVCNMTRKLTDEYKNRNFNECLEVNVKKQNISVLVGNQKIPF